MRYLSIALLILVPSVASAGELLTPRPLDEVAVEAFTRAVAESSTVRNLVATLERSNVIVHILSSRDLRLGLAGTTQFVTSRGGYRYVRITLNAELPKGARTTILAHELQHACEVAESDADDAESVRRLFEMAGTWNGDGYETRAALSIERAVAQELRSALPLVEGRPLAQAR